MSTQNLSVKEPLIRITKRTDVPVWKAWVIRVSAFLIAMLLCGIIALFLIDGMRISDLGTFYASFITGTFSTGRKLWKFFKSVAILLCISLAVTPAFRMKFWNIGAEGQTLVGILGAIAVDFYLGGKINEGLLLVLMLIAAITSGIIWGLLPALCKAKWNTNETLFTLMMNYVASFLVSFCLLNWVGNGSSALGKLDHGGLPVLFGQEYLLIIIVAVLLTALLYVYLNYSKHGYEISVVGGSENTARYVGINVKWVIIRTMILSGALCGLAGYLIAAGLDRSVTDVSVGGQGFTAIMVSWLAKFNPIAMMLTSGIIIFLQQGAAQISQSFDIPGDFPNVVVGLILFFIIGCEFFINYRLVFRKKQSAPATQVEKEGK